MEEKKPKNILYIDVLYENSIISSIEFIKDLISLGHNITCYILDELESLYKSTGAKVKTFHIDKEVFNQVPKNIAKRATVPIIIARSYIIIMEDFLGS